MHHALLHQSTISTTTRVDRVDLVDPDPLHPHLPAGVALQPAHVTHSNLACAPTCSTVF
ncbi:hypothetical protein Ahy_A01g002819 isoform D [Arachis hypogaea]|uniref:Uncharacterized protein n=1 Tax=Arachis hypogaea TaxID=3818 RepID=A0A445ERP7_ARAHY|nr:hypothetical protein Ahy_A01g002819 isoform D [Arachis hypogaea]